MINFMKKKILYKYISEDEKIVWYNIIIIFGWHIGALYGLWLICSANVNYSIIALWPILYIVSGIGGVTAGAHRLWAHKSYEAVYSLRIVLASLQSMSFMGSIYEWVRDHRTHHKGSDTSSDPHNSNRGFFFSHMGWIFVKKNQDVIKLGKTIILDDLVNDPIVMWQKKNYLFTALTMCYGVPVLIGSILQDGFVGAWYGFWIGGVLRHVWTLHMTWLVNSAAHFYGERPYDKYSKPAENLFVSIGAVGEGWHNYHHKFPFDYAAGEYGITQGGWNPTKLFIDTCAVLGLVKNRKRIKNVTISNLRNKNKNLNLNINEMHSLVQDHDTQQ